MVRSLFPYDVFKEYRRKIRRILSALEENCSAAAYGESQVGKSYLDGAACCSLQIHLLLLPMLENHIVL